jgi:small subunit ribosomal protein S2
MASLVKDLIESGIHFGHKTNNWNPKMGPYIHGKKNKIHIIDVKQTIKGLLLARKFLTKIVSGGKDVLFVGTKRQARPCIEKYCKEADQPYVIERWLGGTLTNFRTIRERLKRLEELEGLEESGQLEKYSKKMESTLRREKAKILRNLEGIRNMTRVPGALVIIDVKREHNAVREARKLGIPTVCLIDTDSDPDWADIPIPGNDDAMRSIEVVINSLMAAVNEGKTARAQASEGRDGAGDGKTANKRKSSRPQSDGSASPADEAAAAPATEAPAAPAAEPVAAADGAAPAAG